jgi:hypothetical protein
VQTRVPALPGVYGVSNATEWIYIGESSDLRATLMGILQNSAGAFPQRLPTGFVFEVCDAASLPSRASLLVGEYRPACNSTELGWRRETRAR